MRNSTQQKFFTKQSSNHVKDDETLFQFYHYFTFLLEILLFDKI